MSRFGPATLSGPGFIPPAGTIERLRERRRRRRIAMGLFNGQWRKVLIEAERTQGYFRSVLAGDQRDNAKPRTLVAKVNIVRLAVEIHAEVLTGREPKITVPDAFSAQQQAIERMRDAGMLQATIAEAAATVYRESEAVIVIDLDPSGTAVARVGSNEQWFAVGPVGADRQPTVYERRWIIERPNRSRLGEFERYLRVERRRAGLHEQEAYLTESSDVLQDLTTLKRVPVATAIPEGVRVPPDRIETGVSMLAVRLVRGFVGDDPTWLFPEEDLDLIDASCSALSTLHRSYGIHFAPKMRVGKEMADPRTNKIDSRQEFFVDPDRKVEYITASLAIDRGLEYFEKILATALMQARVPPSLLGARLGAQGQPLSAESRRQESMTTLSAANGTKSYIQPALGRVVTTMCELDTRQGLRGYSVSPVTVQMRPEIPKDFAERIAEQRDAVEAGLTSRRRAVAEIHGEDQSDAVLEEIEADEARRADIAARSSFGAAGLATPDPEDDPDISRSPAPEPEVEVAA